MAKAVTDAGGKKGLTSVEARARLAAHGPNVLVPERRVSPLAGWLLRAIGDPMVVLLLIAGATYVLLNELTDAIVTLTAVVPIVVVSVLLEGRAERTLDRLRKLTTPIARVWRDDSLQPVPADEIVVGDLAAIQEGDVVPADGEVVEGAQIIVDESTLTGESAPVTKDTDYGGDGRQVAAGTTVLSGRGLIFVTATGPRTRYGRIGSLVAGIPLARTPLERTILRLVRGLAVVAFSACAVVVAIELSSGHGWPAAIIAGVSLAIAAMPEEFPMVYTLYLTLGAWRLAKDHALVRRIAAVETLGSTTVICTDKTGTLTLGRLAVSSIALPDGTVQAALPFDSRGRQLLESLVLASELSPYDPLEQAILATAASQGMDIARLQAGRIVRDYPFDPKHKYMTHVWEREGGLEVFAKGSVEGILEKSKATETQRAALMAANKLLADEGMRVIASAAGKLPRLHATRGEDERYLQAMGLVAFSDPLRPGVREALDECRRAGIRVIMITGDHPLTAHAVAEDLDLPHDHLEAIATGDSIDLADDVALSEIAARTSIFARTRPEQKYRIVRALKAGGEIVAMTGDGVNDAPALREADIGVAMGQRGTEVARAAATMVLLDDNFATIVAAVRDGRRIFDSLRKAFSYLIAFHIPILVAALVLPLAGAPLLLLPVHLVLLELLLHPVVSLVFENDPAPADLMTRPPRAPGLNLVTRGELIRPLALGFSLVVGVLWVFLSNLDSGQTVARSLAFSALVVGQSALVIVERSPAAPIWKAPLFETRSVIGIVLAVTVGLLAAVYVPPIAGALSIAPISLSGWAQVLAVAFLCTCWFEPFKRAPAEHRPLSPKGSDLPVDKALLQRAGDEHRGSGE